MPITQKDVDNIHDLEKYLDGTPRTIGEMARHLGVTNGLAITYLEIMAKNPKRYRLECADLAGAEKKGVIA